jgi:dephospho-CoA kinase
MSGTGKSTALHKLGERGHRVVDADTDMWSHWAILADGSTDWVWREDTMTELLTGHRSGKLFVAGCSPNQKQFYLWFDHVALLSAPVEIILARIATRTSNTFGKSPTERNQILRDLAETEPRLRNSATIEIDTSAPLSEVVDKLDGLG